MLLAKISIFGLRVIGFAFAVFAIGVFDTSLSLGAMLIYIACEIAVAIACWIISAELDAWVTNKEEEAREKAFQRNRRFARNRRLVKELMR